MGDGGGIRVSGGAGGVTAGYEDMLAYADRIDASGDDLRSSSLSLGSLLADGDILTAAVLCPAEVAAVEGALTAVAGRAMLDSTGMEVQAGLLRSAVWSYRALDAALATTEDLAWDVAGWTAGAVLPAALVAGGLVVYSNPRLRALLEEHGSELGPGLQETLYDNPWMQEALTRTAPGLVQGSAFSLSALLGPVGPVLLGTATDGAWPSGDYTTAVAGLLNLANDFGYFRDTGGFTIGPVDAPGPRSIDVSESRAVNTIFRRQALLGSQPGTVQIIELANGSYIVQLPGTQALGAVRSDNPVDFATNAALMAGRDTEMERLVTAAMKDIPPGAPVMLTGHSQGGITAAALASDPGFTRRYDVQSVVTGGSPIARYDIPDDISVLSLEHDQDPVPKLDGLDNPDRPNWVTVRRDLPDSVGLSDGSETRDPIAAHGVPNYAATGAQVDDSDDPSIERWRDDKPELRRHGTRALLRHRARTMRPVVLMVVLCLVSACSTADRSEQPRYDPIPDSTLFARVQEVDGIVDASLSYSRTLGDEGYRGEVVVRPTLKRAEVAEAVATVYAILRQGRANATILLEVVQRDTIITDALPGVPSSGTLDELDELFGPQPGDGTPPPR